MLVLKRQSGFSMVELLVGILIMGILFAYGVPNFKDWIQNTQIRNGAEAIQSGLEVARAAAVKRNANVQIVFGTGTSWTVVCSAPVVDLDGDGTADCPGTGTTPDNIQTYTSKEGSSKAIVDLNNVPTVGGQRVVAFNSLGRVTPVPLADIIIKSKNTNTLPGSCIDAGGSYRCLSVVVTLGGQIRMCDPAVVWTAQTPQGC